MQAHSLLQGDSLSELETIISRENHRIAGDERLRHFLRGIRLQEFGRECPIRTLRLPYCDATFLRLMMEENMFVVCYHNSKANRLNNAMVNLLPGEARSLTRIESGGVWRNEYVPKVLVLKKGVCILSNKNVRFPEIPNGARGFYVGYDETRDKILCSFDGKTFRLGRHTWRDEHRGTEMTASQFPIKLGYSSTFYKYQGLTISPILVDVYDFDDATHGGVYSALSRGTNCLEIAVFHAHKELLFSKNSFCCGSHKYV